MDISNNINSINYNKTVYNTQDTEQTNNVAEVSLINIAYLDDNACDTVELSNTEPVEEVTLYTTASDIPTTEVDKIKQILYRLHNNTNVEQITDTHTSKTYNMDNAYDLLKYANSKIGTIDIKKGITRAQLYKFTQDDDIEDNNSQFFGKLFSAFDKIDTTKDSNTDASDDILTYDELNAYLGDIKSDGTLESKIDAYSNELQNEFKTAAASGNATLLNWVIDKATDYIQAAGLNDQLEALDRLQNAGLISLGDCNSGATWTGSGGWTLGAFRYYTTSNSQQWVSDISLMLDQQYYNPNTNTSLQWYDMVGTLVHELTHATAQKYSGVETISGGYNGNTEYDLSEYAFTQLKELYDNGLLSGEDKTWYENYINTNGTSFNSGVNDTDKQKIINIINTFWLECSAYQTDEDYADSIGKGFYNGSNEKQETIAHIQTYYINNGSTYQPGTGVSSNYNGDWWVTYKGSGFTYNA